MPFSFGPYLIRIEAALRAGDATEHAHRGALVEMLDVFAADLGLRQRAANSAKQGEGEGATLWRQLTPTAKPTRFLPA